MDIKEAVLSLDTNVKDWYSKKFRSDELKDDIRADVTFKDINDALGVEPDIYKYIFGDPMKGDSIVRERIFSALSDILGVDYEEVYDRWLDTPDPEVDDMIDKIAQKRESEKKGIDWKDESVEEELNFDREAACDWCGKTGKVAVTHYGTSHYNRLVCPDCAKELKINESITESVDVITAAEFPTLYDGSWYTIEGAGGNVEEWEKGIQDLLNKEGIGEVKRWVTYSGKDMNEWAKLTGTNAYPDDLTFISFPLDGLDSGKLAIFKIRMRDRWFDDIVDNNARREGYHPMGGSHYDESIDEEVSARETRFSPELDRIKSEVTPQQREWLRQNAADIERARAIVADAYDILKPMHYNSEVTYLLAQALGVMDNDLHMLEVNPEEADTTECLNQPDPFANASESVESDPEVATIKESAMFGEEAVEDKTDYAKLLEKYYGADAVKLAEENGLSAKSVFFFMECHATLDPVTALKEELMENFNKEEFNKLYD